MLLTTAVSCFLAFWSLLFLTDFYLRAYSVHWYIKFADRIGLSISIFQVRFYTNRFHQSILYQPLAVSSPYKYSLISKAVSAWFTLGATASLLCFIGITMYLTKVLWDVIINLLPASSYPSEQFVPQIFHLNQVDTSTVLDDLRRSDDMQVGLTPIVPGVNVPWSHLPLFLLVLAIVGIIHELGHALAAIDANVPVSGFGIFLIAFYPGAFTEIETEALGRSTSAQKMRIFGAGIWHNLVLAFFGYLLLLGVPHFLSHLFVINNGVLIREVDSRSGLNGAGGLRKSDVVYAINGCSVRNSAEWYRCLRKIQSNQLGFCFPDKEIQPGITTKINSYDGEVHCCEEFPNVSLSHICFYFKNKTEEKIVPSINAVRNTDVSLALNLAESLGLKGPLKQQARSATLKHLNARTERKIASNFNAFNFLNKRSSVQNRNNHQKDGKFNSKVEDVADKYACLPARRVTEHITCGKSTDCGRLSLTRKSTCVFPALFNGTTLMKIYISDAARPILFIGTTDELTYYVKLSNHLPLYFFSFSWIPHVAELFFKYLITFSLAIALLNAVPCYGLDGQFISKTIIESLFSRLRPERRVMLNRALIYYGIVVLGGNALIGFVRFIRPYLS